MLKYLLLPLSLTAINAFAQDDLNSESYLNNLSKSYLLQNSMVPVGESVFSTTLTLVSDNGCNITGGGSNELSEGGTVLGHNFGRVHMMNDVTCSLSLKINTQYNGSIDLTMPIENGKFQAPEFSQENEQLISAEGINIKYSDNKVTFNKGQGECVLWRLNN